MMLPMVASATAPPQASTPTGLQGVMSTILGLLNTVVVLLISLAVVFFIWGIVKYIMADSDDEKVAGRKTMINGIIAIFVIVSVWGLVNVLDNTFNLSSGSASNPPSLPSTQ